MAKKSKVTKKHRFKYAAPAQPAVAAPVVAKATASLGSAKTAPALEVVAAGRDFSYVGHDIRRILMFAVILIALEAVLSYVLGHTSVGPSVYNFFNV